MNFDENETCPIKVSVGDYVFPNTADNGTAVDITSKELGAAPKKRTTKKKKDDTEKVEVEVVPGPNQSYLETSTPYHQSYEETDNILRSSIAQLDSITAQMNEDLNDLRASKTLRNKYSYISDLTGSMIGAISAKVNAAKELNNTIKNSHELDLKRMKELKLNEQNQDDEKSIMDVYKAFISQPVSTNMNSAFSNPLGASPLELTVGAVPGAIPGGNVNINMMGQNPDEVYGDYATNMTPEQLTMMAEEDPNIKNVITYDQVTGDANFATYNTATGQFINVPQRDKSMMDGIDFDFKTMQAHSNNLNESFDIIYVNNMGQTVPSPIVNDENTGMDQY